MCREGSLYQLGHQCDFDYRGPIRPGDLNCFLEVFPFATPLRIASEGGLVHDVRGIRRGTEEDRQDPPVPIFLVFKDRISVLIEAIRSLHRHIRTPFEIVIFRSADQGRW